MERFNLKTKLKTKQSKTKTRRRKVKLWMLDRSRVVFIKWTR